MKNYIKAIEIGLLLGFFVIGCMSIGGQTSAVKPETVAKLSSELETAQKQIDESKQAIEGVQGDVSTFDTKISTIETTLTNMQIQITKIETTNIQHNESIKSLMWTVAGIWVMINILKFIQMLVAAKMMPGHSLKNIITLPWEKK